MKTACAPILLLGFNRPDLLRGLVGILAKVRPPKLYLAVDGPRPGREGEAGWTWYTGSAGWYLSVLRELLKTPEETGEKGD